MIQTKKAGLKQFFIVIIMTFLIIMVFEFLKFIMPSYGIIADLLSLFSILYFGYNILIHYSAVFTYTVNDKSVKLNRTIGKKNKEVEFPLSSVIGVSLKKPETKYIYNFNPKILSNKNTRYIIYNNKRIEEAVLIEADENMLEFLKKFKTIN